MSKKRNTGTSSLLRLIADFVEVNGEQRLIDLLSSAAASPKEKSDHVRGLVAVGDIAAKLVELSSRDEGEAYLQAHAKGRRDLEAVARFLQLPVQSDDKVDRLRAKIIENTIGSRLRSEAIQGDNQ